MIHALHLGLLSCVHPHQHENWRSSHCGDDQGRLQVKSLESELEYLPRPRSYVFAFLACPWSQWLRLTPAKLAPFFTGVNNHLLTSLESEFKPATTHQEFLVNQMAGARWKLNRLEHMENQMFSSLDDPTKAFTDEETAKKFARLERYRVNLERTYHRSLRELRLSKKEQKEAKSRQLEQKAMEDLTRIRRARGGQDLNFRSEPVTFTEDNQTEGSE